LTATCRARASEGKGCLPRPCTTIRKLRTQRFALTLTTLRWLAKADVATKLGATLTCFLSTMTYNKVL
jgi:hypothetical protein